MKKLDLKQTITLLVVFILGALSNQAFSIFEEKVYSKSKRKFEYRSCLEVGTLSEFSDRGASDLKVNELGKEG